MLYYCVSLWKRHSCTSAVDHVGSLCRSSWILPVGAFSMNKTWRHGDPDMELVGVTTARPINHRARRRARREHLWYWLWHAARSLSFRRRFATPISGRSRLLVLLTSRKRHVESLKSCTNNVLRDVVVITLRLLCTIRCCNNSVRGTVETDACVLYKVPVNWRNDDGWRKWSKTDEWWRFVHEPVTVLFKCVDHTSATHVDAIARKHTDAAIRRNFKVSSFDSHQTLSWLELCCWASHSC